MLDGFRFVIKNKCAFEHKVITDKLMDYKLMYSETTGAIDIYPKRAVWKGLKSSIRRDEVYIEGSLHKFFNELITGTAQNFDDFGLSRISTAIDGMKLVFGDSIKDADITMLEMGFNLRVNENVQDMLKYKFLLYRFISHNLKDLHKGKGYEKGFRRGEEYRWKLYDKGGQYDLPYNVVRIELKITNKRVLTRFGIYKPEDLLNANNLNLLFSFFMNEFNQFMIIDDFGEHLNFNDKQYLNKITNERHWLNFQKLQVTDRIINKRKEQATKFLKDRNLNLTHTSLIRMLKDKFQTLINS